MKLNTFTIGVYCFLKQSLKPTINQYVINSFEEDAFHASRRASSTCKKGMFLIAVRPLLVSSSASFQMERGLLIEITQQI